MVFQITMLTQLRTWLPHHSSRLGVPAKTGSQTCFYCSALSYSQNPTSPFLSHIPVYYSLIRGSLWPPPAVTAPIFGAPLSGIRCLSLSCSCYSYYSYCQRAANKDCEVILEIKEEVLLDKNQYPVIWIKILNLPLKLQFIKDGQAWRMAIGQRL